MTLSLEGGWTSGGVPVRTLSHEGVWTRDGVPVKTLNLEGVWIVRSHIDWREERVLARKVDPEGGGLCDPTSIGEGNDIDGRWERVTARMLGFEGEWIVRSHISWGGERNILYKGVETSS